MKKIFLSTIMLMAMLACSLSASAVTITKTVGWFESGAVEWTWESGATYTVSISDDNGTTWKVLDKELVRQYSTCGRADAVGLKAGSYMFKVASSASGDATTSFTAIASDRNGFAHFNREAGVGAYNNDGTLKTNARVLYVTAATAKTVTCDVNEGGKTDVTETGIQNIIAGYEKGKETRPLDIRIIGTVKKADLDGVGSSAEGLQVKGKGGDIDMNITIEGIGNDATVHGFGFLVRGAGSVEFRNFAIMICMDDCLSLDTDNKHVWIHNMDFFYGGTGGDADQAKGDGTVDIKGKSSFVTVSYNHFYDSGKCSLGGMKSETTDCWMTYHHNWFDHSDSRHPRIRTAFYHVYNNYFDGVAKYGTGVTMGGSAFCESNYYRNTKYPFLSSKQGTDAQGDGTFSGENGGVIKAFNNKIINPKQVLYYDGSQTDGVWDAVQVKTRDENVTATAFTGGTSYNNAATTSAIAAVPATAIDDPADVAVICRGDKEGRLGAGRMERGDFTWTFYYPTQDTNYGVITDLKQALVDYKSTLVAYGDGTAAGNAGGTLVNGGDGKGKAQSYGDDTNKPDYGGGGGDIPETDDMQAYLTSISSSTLTDGDFYWFNTENDNTTTTKVVGDTKIVRLPSGNSYSATPEASDEYKYGLKLATSTGEVVFYCSTGIPYISAKCYRTGSLVATAYQSENGTTWTKIGDFKASKGQYALSFASTGTESGDVTTYPKYIKLSNGSTGGLYIEGIKIYTVKDGEAAITPADLTDDNNANATVTLDGEKISSQSYTKNIDFADETASYTIVVTPAVSAATVSATSLAKAVEGQTNTWTVDAPAKESQAKVNVKFTVTSKDGSNSKVYSVSILRGDDPTPGPTPTPVVGDTIYNYFKSVGTTAITSSDADKIKASTLKLKTNTTSTNGLAFGKSAAYSDTEKTVLSDYYVKITPESGSFKTGDVLSIAGAFNNTDDSKLATIKILGAAQDSIYNTKQFINGRLVNDDPVLETYTLTKDEDCLYLLRNGNTNTFITTLYVVRPKTTAIKVIDADDPSKSGNNAVKYIQNGTFVIIKSGNMYNAVGAQIK